MAMGTTLFAVNMSVNVVLSNASKSNGGHRPNTVGPLPVFIAKESLAGENPLS